MRSKAPPSPPSSPASIVQGPAVQPGMRNPMGMPAILMLLLGAGVLVLLVELAPYRMQRLIAFLDPWSVAFGSGYQLTQALIAFGRGELFGLGLGEGIQKLFYLPEAHNDFIFAVVAEELGAFGSPENVMSTSVLKKIYNLGTSVAEASLLKYLGGSDV